MEEGSFGHKLMDTLNDMARVSLRVGMRLLCVAYRIRVGGDSLAYE